MKLFSSLIFFLLLNCGFAQTDSVNYYFENGQISAVIPFLNGVREGEARFFYESGAIKEERNYVNDKVDGIVKTYYLNGNLKEVYNIENGKRLGPASYYDSLGNHIEDVIFVDGLRAGQEFLLVGEYREEDYQKYLAEWKQRQQRTTKEDELSLPPKEEDKINYEEDPAYYQNVEIMPEPIGGMNAIYKRLTYPKEAMDKKIEGTVSIRAFIETSGEVSIAEVVEGVHPLLDEAARLAIYYTRFKPGFQRGSRIKVQTVILVEFKLDRK